MTPRARLLALSFAASISSLVPTPSAFANGRFPAAGQIVVDPSDSQRIVLRATFGLMQSTDGGQTWRWICEQSLGYSGIEDPAVGITKSGNLIAGIFEGLTQSTDRGCTFGFAPGPLADQYVVDTAVDPSNPSRAVAVTSTTVANGIHVVLAQTTDDGATWSQVGVPIDPMFRALTVEVAPSDPKRVYVSGVYGSGTQGMLARTDDLGQTWTMLPLTLPGDAYVSAVDPSDADRVWVRVDGTDQDSLELSKDGGKTFTTVSTVPGEMLGFALSPDGKTVAIGGPAAGLLVASTADDVFTKSASVGVRCLRWHSTGLYACGDEGTDGFTLGRSTDGGATFAPLYHLVDSKPLDCPASTPTHDLCLPAWPNVANQIGANPAIGTGGAGGAGGAPSKPKADAGGCSCTVSNVASDASAWLAAGVVLTLALRRRR